MKRFLPLVVLLVLVAGAGPVFAQSNNPLDGPQASWVSVCWDGEAFQVEAYLEGYRGWDFVLTRNTFQVVVRDTAPGEKVLFDSLPEFGLAEGDSVSLMVIDENHLYHEVARNVADMSVVCQDEEALPPAPAEVSQPVELPPVPGCPMFMPEGGANGVFLHNTALYYAPDVGALVYPVTHVAAGSTARVLGVDTTGEYFQIVWGCQLLWVPVGSMVPDSGYPWNGAMLPTEVVS